MNENKIINGVWDGPALSNLEILSIQSFQKLGHEYHLYCSQPTARIPDGVIVHKAEEVVAADAYTWFTNPGHYSDYVRYNLIYKVGGWYCDVDIVPLRFFDFPDPYVFLAENEKGGMSDKINTRFLTSCLFKAPAGCHLLKIIIDEMEAQDLRNNHLPFPLSDINLGNGPPMFRRWVPKLGLESFIKTSRVFDVFDWNLYAWLFSGDHEWSFPEGSYAMHFRRSFWTYNNWDTNGSYHPNSLYEKLKRGESVKTHTPICPRCSKDFYNTDDFGAHACETPCSYCGQKCATPNLAAIHLCGARYRAELQKAGIK
jgi:hypothetical protein